MKETFIKLDFSLFCVSVNDKVRFWVLQKSFRQWIENHLLENLGIFKNIFALTCFLFCCFSSILVSAEPVSLFGKANFENSPRLVKIKIPFDLAQANIGVLKPGFIKDEKTKYSLKPLMKYRIKLNAKGNYDLLVVKDSQAQQIASFAPPIQISTDIPDSAIYFNNSWYHGEVNLEESNSGITAINELDLEYAIWGLLSPMVRVSDSAEAIKAASIIIRSSLFALTFSSTDNYHLNANTLYFKGLDLEKDFVVKLVKETEGEVLFNANGEILFTPLRSTALPNAATFELIGTSSKAWEKVFTLKEVEAELSKIGIHTGPIISFKQSVTSSWYDVEPYVSGPIILIDGLAESSSLEMKQAQSLFNLPSPFFRIYSFHSEDGEPCIQFIGSIPNQPNSQPNAPLLNLVRFTHEGSSPLENYKQILKKMYPDAYLSKI